MARVTLTLPARNDLEEIWSFIARDSLDAADRLIDQIHETCSLYATQPAAGVPADRYQEGLRHFSVASYVVFYRPMENGMVVVRVLHGARDIESHFRDQPE